MRDGARALLDLIAVLSGKPATFADWTPVLQLASETLTIGSLASAALGSPSEADLPGSAKALLTDVLERASERNRRLREQALEAVQALNAVGVEPILMRGIASVVEGRGDRGRLLSDIDLLVPAVGRDESVAALQALGYGIFQGFHGPPHAVALGRTSDVGLLDLHTDLQPYSLRVTYERVAPLCRRSAARDGAMLVPQPTCALLFHILHDQLHDGDYWRGLIDVRHLMEMPGLIAAGVDWPALAAFFPAGSARNAMNVHLRTANALLGADVPPEYVGGRWAALQVRRRMLQLRFTPLRPLLTLVSLALDPPRLGGGGARRRPLGRSVRGKMASAFRPVNPGKASLPRRHRSAEGQADAGGART